MISSILGLLSGLAGIAKQLLRWADVRRWQRQGYEKAELEARRKADANRRERDALDAELDTLDADALRNRLRAINRDRK